MLGVKPVGIREEFFDLGGESLQLLRLASQIEKRLGVESHLAAIFHARTVEGLARLVESKKKWLRPQR
jgi:tyrocidine synthetase-3